MKLKKWYMLFIVYFLGGGKGVLGGGVMPRIIYIYVIICLQYQSSLFLLWLWFSLFLCYQLCGM